MEKEEKRYVVRNSNDILKSVDSFCHYYKLIHHYIDLGVIKSSVDRGAFARPKHALNRDVLALLGAKRSRSSYAYGPEAGDYAVREEIAVLQNLKYGTSFSVDNIAMVAGAWSGVELIVEELACLRKGHVKDITIAVIGPTHYQMFHRAINMLGVSVIGFDFIKPGMGSVPMYDKEVLEILSFKPDAIFIANPNNPNGEYFPSQLLRNMIEICERKDIYVIIDEIQDFLPIDSSKGLNYGKWIQSKNVIRIDSFSKKRGLAEYRVGWVIADRSILGDRTNGVIGRLSGFMGNAPRAANTAILKLLEYERVMVQGGQDSLDRVWKDLSRKRNFVLSQLRNMPNIDVMPHDACFNIAITVNSEKTDLQFSEDLMKNGTLVMACAGYGYDSNDTVLRITFAERMYKLKHAMRVLRKVASHKW